MNNEEQTLIDGLFSRLQQAETDGASRDPDAEARIKNHLMRQPSAGYYMTQAILVQEAAIKQLDEQNRQLQAQLQQVQEQLQQARAQSAAPVASGNAPSTGFLSSIFGGGHRDPQPTPTPTPTSSHSGGGWREPSRSSFGSAPDGTAPQNFNPAPNYGAQAAAQPAAQQPAGSGFLGGALKTAAGVAGGVMLAQGISSLFGHNQQPPVVEEIVKEEPSPASDSGGGWGDDSRMASNDSGSAGQGGPSDADFFNDDSSFFSDDDSFV